MKHNGAFLNKFQGFTSIIREHLCYNNGHQEVVTSVHFVKNLSTIFAKHPGVEPRAAGLSQIFSLMLCRANCWRFRCEQLFV